MTLVDFDDIDFSEFTIDNLLIDYKNSKQEMNNALKNIDCNNCTKCKKCFYFLECKKNIEEYKELFINLDIEIIE